MMKLKVNYFSCFPKSVQMLFTAAHQPHGVKRSMIISSTPQASPWLEVHKNKN